MPVDLVPYHLDENLPGLDAPLEPGSTVTAVLPPGGQWEPVAAVCSAVADAVAGPATVPPAASARTWPPCRAEAPAPSAVSRRPPAPAPGCRVRLRSAAGR